VSSEKEENTAHDNNNFGQYVGQKQFMSYILHKYIYYIYISKITDKDEDSDNANTNINATSNSSSYNNEKRQQS
jgi:hypothetical protein